MRENSTCATHPARKPTRRRSVPCASDHFGQRHRLLELRQHAHDGRYTSEQPQNAEALQHQQRAQQHAQPLRMREDPRDQRAPPAIEQRPPVMLLDKRARCFDEVAVAHARRAGRLAGPAPEAQIEMARDVGRHPDGAVLQRLHEIDPPARRIHLGTELAVGRAGAQTEAAMDAVEKLLVLDEAADGGRRHSAHMPPTNLPGLNRPLGSSIFLTPRINEMPGTSASQVSRRALRRAGSRSKMAHPSACRAVARNLCANCTTASSSAAPQRTYAIPLPT